MKARYVYHPLDFIVPGGTSRGVLHKKDSWFIILEDDTRTGIGECSLIQGLNPEDVSSITPTLEKICQSLNIGKSIDPKDYSHLPSVRMGLEMAFRDYSTKDDFVFFDSGFNNGGTIAINGLVWMGQKENMLSQIKEKIRAGYKCVKLKIAAIDFDDEIELIAHIRKEYDSSDIQIRVDANGGFLYESAFEKLKRLSQYDIHSIEQPIKPGQIEYMAELCASSPVPIALDEELIGVYELDAKRKLIEDIKPQYIILKPSLLGGFAAADEWVDLVNETPTKWWATSALESNVGLSAIAQWVYKKSNPMFQGLGTGKLFSNNIDSPLYINNAKLCSGKEEWDMRLFSI